MKKQSRERALTRALGTAALTCLLMSAQAIAAPHIRIGGMVRAGGGSAPTDAECRAAGFGPCYSPQEIRTAYGLNKLIDAGMVGSGQTIVLIESYGSPTALADLKIFDKDYGLPDPPSLKVLAPLGTVPFDPNDSTQVGWAAETSLDVQWAHAIAPGAAIVVLTSPVAETEGVQGLPEFLALEQYALDHHLGKIISQSWSATENTLFDAAGRKVLDDFSDFYSHARRKHVTVLASAGDSGSSNVGPDSVTVYPFPTVGFPASSPLVTAVGGTSLYTDTAGHYKLETVWDEVAAGGGAGGGGISQVFREPEYQRESLPDSMQDQLHGKRGLPDISYNADPYTPILIYVGFLGSASAGYYSAGGTSEGSPQWAGIVADLNQYAGRPLGFLNRALYAIGGSGQFKQIGRDIKVGNNGYNGVPGYAAGAGWDLATGWGTPDLDKILSRELDLLDPSEDD
ncbi:MAG: S53 family peptidase [Pseudomonadota bacterium]|nr:S53 family peptidase [Pseudomonadota bacterium]